MHTNIRLRSAWLVLVPAVIWIASASAHASGRTRSGPGPQGFEFNPRAAGHNRYVVVPLVSDGFVAAPFTDHNLVNPWGLATGPRGPFWVADNDTGVATLYDGDGVANPLVVSLPSGARPTGLVFNIGDNFVVREGEDFGPSFFIFAGEDGRIFGWNPAVPRGFPSPIAFLAHDDSASGAIYKGLALALTGSGDRLYATDFHNRSVTVLDGTFEPVTLPEGAFVDPGIPEDFGPFGIQNIQGRIFVTYARRDAAGEDDVAGPGLGFVSVFDTDGAFLARIATRGPLNAPWGMTLAPPGFGRFGGDLLVGNFGGGNIVAYRLSDDFLRADLDGALSENGGHPIVIHGLWGLAFGNDRGAGSSDSLFFTAGPGDERHGLFGRIEPR